MSRYFGGRRHLMFGAAVVLGLMVSQFVVSHWLRPAQPRGRLYRIDPVSASPRLFPALQGSQGMVQGDFVVDVEQETRSLSEDGANDADVALPQWAPRLSDADVSFRGGSLHAETFSSEWTQAKWLDQTTKSRFPREFQDRLDRKFESDLELNRKALEASRRIGPAPWLGEEFQFFSTVGDVFPPFSVPGSQFAPTASPELSLVWYEASQEKKLAGDERSEAIELLKRYEIERRAIFKRIIDRVVSLSTGSGHATQLPKRGALLIRTGCVYLVSADQDDKVAGVLASFRKRFDRFTADLEQLR